MPNSYTTIDLDAGSSGTNAVNQTVFGPFTFDYINSADVQFAVKVSSVWKLISVASFDTGTKLVTLSATPQTSASAAHTDEARVFRSTTLSPVVDFQSGSRISEADLDNAYRQGLFAAQEATEDAPGSASRTVQATDDIQDNAIDADKLATDAVETTHIKNLQVTAGKLAATLDLSGKDLTLPANTVTLASIPDGTIGFAKLHADAVIDDDTMASASNAKLSTSSSIKAYTDAYTDSKTSDPARVYNSLVHSTVSATVIQNTTGRPLWASFSLLTTDELSYLILEISPNADMSSLTRIGQLRIQSDGDYDAGGQVTGIVPAGWYWKYTYSGSETITEKVHSSFML